MKVTIETEHTLQEPVRGRFHPLTLIFTVIGLFVGFFAGGVVGGWVMELFDNSSAANVAGTIVAILFGATLYRMMIEVGRGQRPLFGRYLR